MSEDWTQQIRIYFPDWRPREAVAKWPLIKSQLSVGQRFSGVVIARAPFGVWLDIAVGHPALLLVPEMAGARERPIKFEDYPAIGTTIEANIVWLGNRGEINLTQTPDGPKNS